MLNSLPNETTNKEREITKINSQDSFQHLLFTSRKKIKVKCSSSATDCKYMHSRSQAKQFFAFLFKIR